MSHEIEQYNQLEKMAFLLLYLLLVRLPMYWIYYTDKIHAHQVRCGLSIDVFNIVIGIVLIEALLF